MLHKRAGGAIEVADGPGEQRCRVERAAAGADLVDDDAVGFPAPEGRHEDGNGDDREADQRGGDQRRQAGENASQRALGREPMNHDRRGEEIGNQHRHLVAAEDHEPGDKSGRESIGDGAAVQRPAQQPPGDRPPAEREDLAEMLDAPARRRAEGEGERGNDRATPVPAAVAEEQDDAGAAGEEHREDGDVHGLEAGARQEGGDRHQGRDEQHRLRIGDFRRAREDVGRPGKAEAAMDGARCEDEVRVPVGLGVPGDRHGAGKPGPAEDQPAGREEQQGGGEAKGRGRGRGHGRRRWVRQGLSPASPSPPARAVTCARRGSPEARRRRWRGRRGHASR